MSDMRWMSAKTVDEQQRSLFHLLDDVFVDRVAKIFDGTLAALEHDGLGIVGGQPARFGVDPHEVEGRPHLDDEFVDVHPLLGGYGDAVGDLVSARSR